MARKKLLEDIIRNPARFYRVPADVLRDRRFGDAERAEILRAWLALDAEREPGIAPALAELESRGDPDDGVNHAAE